MLKIAVLFDVPLRTIKRVDSKIYCVSVNSITCLSKIRDYFSKYPLMSSQICDYKCWLLANDGTSDKSHLTEVGKEKIVVLKSEMNSKRTFFNWDHLN